MINARRCTASLAQALWRGAGRDQGAAAAAPALVQRSLQTSCDDRDIGSNTFDRTVRVYDKNGKLSRHMNPEIDEIVLKFETSLGLPPLMSASPPRLAHSNPTSPGLGYTHTQTAHPSRHTSPDIHCKFSTTGQKSGKSIRRQQQSSFLSRHSALRTTSGRKSLSVCSHARCVNAGFLWVGNENVGVLGRLDC